MLVSGGTGRGGGSSRSPTFGVSHLRACRKFSTALFITSLILSGSTSSPCFVCVGKVLLSCVSSGEPTAHPNVYISNLFWVVIPNNPTNSPPCEKRDFARRLAASSPNLLINLPIALWGFSVLMMSVKLLKIKAYYITNIL